MGYVVTNSSFILSIIVYGEIALLNGCNIGNYSGEWCEKCTFVSGKGVFQMKKSLAMMALIVVMALSALGALPAANAASTATASSNQVIAYSVFSTPHAPASMCC